MIKNCYNNITIKGGKDPKDVRSYRLVVLNNILCKIFERITNNRQFGFKNQKRTVNVLKIIKIILDGFKINRKQLQSSSKLRKLKTNERK